MCDAAVGTVAAPNGRVRVVVQKRLESGGPVPTRWCWQVLFGLAILLSTMKAVGFSSQIGVRGVPRSRLAPEIDSWGQL